MFRKLAVLIILLIITITIVAQDDPRIRELLLTASREYERVSDRNGRLLFWKNYEIHRQPPMSPAPPPYNPHIETYDFIIVGAGSAGAALANRLSENPKWKILLLEVGKPGMFISDIPAIAATLQFTDYNWGYLMEKQDNVCLGLEGQRMAWPRGRALGGSSIINYMIHVRGNPGDYDRWAKAGNSGWSYKDVLPYFKKLEDCSVLRADYSYRNRGGPISVQDVPYRTESVHAWVKSAMEAGHKYVDYNGKEQMGVSYVQASTRRGLRCSTDFAYLKPALDRPNLVVLTQSRATKLILEGNKVVGVQYVRKRQYNTANATKEVIISAGTFNSPQLLMLSGIGPKDHLQELGIPVIRDLPIGQKMYDHYTFLGLVFTLNETKMTFDQNELYKPSNFLELVNNGTGILSSLGGVESLLYFQTNVSRDKDRYPDMELIFIGGGMHSDEGLVYRKSFRISDRVYNAIWKPLEGKQAFSVLPMLIHPYSKGYIKLKSKNPYHWPRLYGNPFTDPEKLDIKTFIAAIREVQRISKMPTFQRFGATQVKTKVPGCEYFEWDTDEYWECALRHITGTLHHQVATCKMGPQNDAEAVVDHKLKVYGIQGLRVADCSVIPIPLSAHTNIPAVMIGEKAADLIKEEWVKGNKPFDPRRQVKY